jgi:hypothetical protein
VPRRKSTSSGERPKISPWRNPRPTPRTTAIRYLFGSSSETVATHAADHGTTFFASRFGAETDPALHGFLAIRSSSTAADRIAETVPSATPMADRFNYRSDPTNVRRFLLTADNELIDLEPRE